MTAKRISLLCLGGLLLLVSWAAPGWTTDPERGNFVPPDLDVRTHPFVEHERFGGSYLSGILQEPTDEGWRVTLSEGDRPTVTVPEYRITLDSEHHHPGTRVMIQQLGPDDYLISGLDRRFQYLLLLAVGLGLCMVIGGWVTTRALVAMMLGIGFFYFWTVPQINDGSWILGEIGLFYTVTTVMVLPAVMGFTRRTVSALITAFTTGILAYLILVPLGYWLNITGMWSDSFQVLDYAVRYFPDQAEPIHFRNLILGATLIGALGVILDVCVDVTASAAEIARQRPDLSLNQLLARTITVSSRLVGTMTNTLLLAYIGSKLFLLITLYLIPRPVWLVFNQDLVAVEVIRSLGGALAFLGAVPLAILFYGLLFRSDRPDPPEDPSESTPDLDLADLSDPSHH